MKAVITGATGAVGMALIRKLTELGNEVAVLCRSSSPRSSNIPAGGLVKKIDCPLDKMSSLELDGERYDVFFHLAWDGTTGAARNDMYLQNLNVKYTLDAVCLAKKLGCKTFVFAGSQAEYGRTEEKLFSRTPAFPENGYGMAKLCAAQMSRTVCREQGIKHIHARILSVYGEYDGERSLVMSTVKKLLNGEKTSFTAGEQMWDYMYSSDAAKALIALAEDGRDGGIYCLGSGEARPLREYIEMIRDAVGSTAPLGLGEIPYADGQVMYLCANTEELIRDTGYVPSTSFKDGIKRTVEWYIKKGKTEK